MLADPEPNVNASPDCEIVTSCIVNDSAVAIFPLTNNAPEINASFTIWNGLATVPPLIARVA